MATTYYHSYAENAGIAADGADHDIGAASHITIPAGSRAVIRRVDGFYMGAGNCTIRVRTGTAAGARVYGTSRVGIGALGGACFVYIDAIAAAVVLVPTAQNTNGATLCGVAVTAVSQI